MVLTQPGTIAREASIVKRFPYHYGSHATKKMSYWTAFLSLFPYHYGSYKSRPSLTVQEHEPVLRKNSCELLVPSCKLKSKGKGVKRRHSDKAPGRNLDAIASWFFQMDREPFN